MRQFYDLSTDWVSAILSGLPYVCKLRKDETLFWVDADLYDEADYTSVRVSIPSKMLMEDERDNISRESFLKYLAPQVVEYGLEHSRPNDLLIKMANHLDRFHLTIRKEWVIETESFATYPTAAAGYRNLLMTTKRVEAFYREKIARGEIKKSTAEFILLTKFDFLPKAIDT